MAIIQHHRENSGAIERRIILLVCFMVFVFLVWAASFSIDEVAVGQGRVIPSSKTQLVQSVQGGRLIEIMAKEGEIVEAGQLLAVLDTTQFDSELAEVQAAVLEAEAQQQVLTALLTDQDEIVLTGDAAKSPILVQQKGELFQKVLGSHLQAVADIRTELDLLQKERGILDQARLSGGSTDIEMLRLDQKIAATTSRLNEVLQSYKSDLQLKLDDVNKAVQQLNIRLSGMKGTMTGSELRSPTRGVVQKIPVSTEGGGVLPPNGTVMEIVPIEERLLIEARFSPRDIAFISPDLTARIKVSAYDFSIFGDLEARVLRVSPDSIQYEGRPGDYYFAVTLESTRTYFETPDGKQLAIMPGMVTTTEIVTGSRTILQYLLKPLAKATDALRER